MDYPSGTLIGIHPVANLQQCKLEKPQINYVTRMLANLNPVTQVKRFARQDKYPAGDIGKHILQCNGQTCSEQSQKCSKLSDCLDPYTSNENNGQKTYNKRKGPLPGIPGFGSSVNLQTIFSIANRMTPSTTSIIIE